MNVVIIDTEDSGVIQPLGSLGHPWICRDINRVLHCVYNKWFAAEPTWRIMHGYSSDNGATWTTEEISGAPSGDGWAIDAAIVTDSLARVHVFYEFKADASSDHIIKHATKTGSSWTSEDVTSWTANTPASAYGSLAAAIDSSNNIYLLFKRRTGAAAFDLRYITNSSGAWASESTVMSGTVSADIPGSVKRLIIGSDGVLHFVYTLSNQAKYRTGKPPGSEVALDSYVADSLAASEDSIFVGMHDPASFDGYMKELPNSGSWQTAKSAFVADSGHSSQAYVVVSVGMEALLGQIDFVDYKIKLWRELGGSWYGSIYESITSGMEFSTGRALAHYHPISGLVATDELIMLWELSETATGYYSIAFLSGVLLPTGVAVSGFASGVTDIITLEALRNIEISAMGRVYVDEQGKLKYESRFGRNV